MAENSWGYGGPNQPETGISQVLAGYASRGGQLIGARRLPENPLTLTHVRWIGPDGFQVEAVRRSDDDDSLLPEEREVWVQLALHCPMSNMPPTHPQDVPWLQIAVEPGHVAGWLRILQRARASQYSNPGTPGVHSGGYVNGGYGGPPPGPAHYPTPGPMAGRDHAAPYDLGPMGNPAPRSRPLYAYPQSTYPQSTPSVPEAPGGYGQGTSDPNGWTNSWQRSPHDQAEVIVLPCIEVEMPMLLGDPTTADGVRDFTRDVATNFGRACKQIPQVRETRGWMHGNRLVLAARMAVAPGTRAPTHAEMEGAANILADTLARRTLPYTRLGFADPGAWAQGTALPE